jgi:hypothetical protein
MKAFVLLALACMVGCTSELARQQTPDQQLDEIARQQEWTAWSQAMNTWDPSVGEEFLRRYPNSVYRQRVQEKVEELRAQMKDRPAYQPYKMKDTIEGYKEFIAKYPDNAFVSEARNRLTELEAEQRKIAEQKKEAEIFEENLRKERWRFCSFVPKDKQVVTRKFLVKVKGIFESVKSYYYSSLGSRYGGGILRKDIDRYTDAVADATGEVPDQAIAWVEETYSLLRDQLGSPNIENSLKLLTRELTIGELSASSDWSTICK